MDEYLTRTTSNGSLSYMTDALGSTLALTDATGAINTQYSYEAYGNTTQSGTISDNAFQYTGRENDGTGLYYYRARYYDSQSSRFISQDPIGFGGGVNQFGYVGGNPVDRTDPLGNSWQTALIGGLVGAVANGLNYSSQGCNFWKGAENGFAGGLIAGASPNLSGFVAGAVVTEYLNQQQGVMTVPDPSNQGTSMTPSQQSYAFAIAINSALGPIGNLLHPVAGAAFGVGSGSGLSALQNLGGAISGSAPPCGCK